MGILVGQIPSPGVAPYVVDGTDVGEQSVNATLNLVPFILGDIERPSKAAGLTQTNSTPISIVDVNTPQIRVISRSRRFFK